MTGGRVPRIVVVGAGIAGAAAALAATGAGAELLGIERSDRFGGTASRAGGGYCAAGTDEQRLRAIADSPQRALADHLRGQETHVDQVWARRYFRASNRLVHGVLSGLGVRTRALVQFERDSVPRWHMPEGGGAAVMACLRAALAARGQDGIWRFGLQLRALTHAEGRIDGVLVGDAAGHRHRIAADAVILATGGFAQNAALVSRHAGATTRDNPFLTAGGPEAAGDALAILETVGAGFSGLERVYFYPFITRAAGRDPGCGVAIRGMDRGIWLNARLERFLDETKITLGQSAARRLFAQPDASAWAIVDSRSIDGIVITDHYHATPETPAETLTRYRHESPDVVSADSLPALARAMGVSPAALEAAVSDWNAQLCSGAKTDPLTGRALAPEDALRRPPFLAVRMRPGARKTLGGVRTDLQARVLTAKGQVIPGLYAAGELAGFAGGSIAGETPLEGMMVGASFLSGMVAGRHARRFVPQNPGRALGVENSPTMSPTGGLT